MYGRPTGGLLHPNPRTRAMIQKLHTRHAHTDASFLRRPPVGKGVVCKFAGHFGLDGESAGGKGA